MSDETAFRVGFWFHAIAALVLWLIGYGFIGFMSLLFCLTYVAGYVMVRLLEEC